MAFLAAPKYTSDITLGQRYRDPQTGIEGVATGVHFYQYGCERVSLETVVAGKIEEYSFDAPRLLNIETQERARSTRTGGPEPSVRQASARPSTPGR
jgi:hypothetical protein